MNFMSGAVSPIEEFWHLPIAETNRRISATTADEELTRVLKARREKE